MRRYILKICFRSRKAEEVFQKMQYEGFIRVFHGPNRLREFLEKAFDNQFPLDVDYDEKKEEIIIIYNHQRIPMHYWNDEGIVYVQFYFPENYVVHYEFRGVEPCSYIFVGLFNPRDLFRETMEIIAWFVPKSSNPKHVFDSLNVFSILEKALNQIE